MVQLQTHFPILPMISSTSPKEYQEFAIDLARIRDLRKRGCELHTPAAAAPGAQRHILPHISSSSELDTHCVQIKRTTSHIGLLDKQILCMQRCPCSALAACTRATCLALRHVTGELLSSGAALV